VVSFNQITRKSKENFESVSTKASLLNTKVEKPLVCEVPIEVLEDLKNGNDCKKDEEKKTETQTVKDEIDTCVNNVISNKSSKKHKRKRHSSKNIKEKDTLALVHLERKNIKNPKKGQRKVKNHPKRRKVNEMQN